MLLACCGCRVLCPERSTETVTGAGQVRQLDCATRRRLVVVGQQMSRDGAGRTVVRVTWRNRSAKDYHAEIRVVFRDDAGREVEVLDWSGQAFRGGMDTILEWTSSREGAASYLIELRKVSAMVF